MKKSKNIRTSNEMQKQQKEANREPKKETKDYFEREWEYEKWSKYYYFEGLDKVVTEFSLLCKPILDKYHLIGAVRINHFSQKIIRNDKNYGTFWPMEGTQTTHEIQLWIKSCISHKYYQGTTFDIQTKFGPVIQTKERVYMHHFKKTQSQKTSWKLPKPEEIEKMIKQMMMSCIGYPI